MSASNPRSGCASMWLLCSVLFISIVAGGGCLIVYMILPKPQSTSWLPVAGVTLVCLPWLFWFLTFLYQVISCVCRFRHRIHGVDAGGDGGAPNVVTEPPSDSQGKQAGHLGVMVVGNQNGHGGMEGKLGKQSRSSSYASNNLHESEMPLALSLVS